MGKDSLKQTLDKIKLFVLDMDGTIYLGNHLFPFTKRFLHQVRASGKEFCFFTNNSSKNRQAYIQKLSAMGIPVEESQMLLSNDVIIDWLCANHKGKSAYVVGTPYLEKDFQESGIPLNDRDPDMVVLGFDTTLTYEKLSKACTFIRQGKPVYGVNADWNCPVENGFIPDCGSIAALVKASTGVQCEFFGKPSRHTLDYILNHAGMPAHEIAIVGDRLYTDIAVADQTDVTSILVLSGETKESDIPSSSVKPDFTVRDISVLTENLLTKH